MKDRSVVIGESILALWGFVIRDFDQCPVKLNVGRAAMLR